MRGTTLLMAAILLALGLGVRLLDPTNLSTIRQVLFFGSGMAVLAGRLLPLRWNQRLILAAGASLVCLLVAEVSLQIGFPHRFSPIYQLDPVCLHKLTPGGRRTFQRSERNGGQTIPVEINSRGFRGPELRQTKSRRIVVYGDSFVEGEFSRLGDTFAAQLAARLGNDIEVVNAGVVAYGPDQACVRMEREVAELDPDLLVLALYAGNDFGDLIRNKLFRLAADGTLRKNEFSLGEKLEAKFWLAEHEPIVLKIIENGLVRLRNLVRGRGAPISAANLKFIAQSLETVRAQYRECARGDNTVRVLLGDHYDADVALTPNSESARYKVRLMDRVVERIGGIATRAHVPLVILVIPSPIDVIEAHSLGTVDVGKYPNYRRSTLTDLLAGIARKHGIPVLDLYPPLRAHGADAFYFWGHDNHWNDAGQAFAAELLVRLITQRALLH